MPLASMRVCKPRKLECRLTKLSVIKSLILTSCRLLRLSMFNLISFFWLAYSNKVGAGSVTTSQEKLERVIEQFNNLRPNVTGIQANFIFGLDADMGDEPIELTKEFASRIPFVMPNFNIPVPFGSTPLYEKYLREDRLLATLPFTFLLHAVPGFQA
jgi:hypothetical protein